MSTETDVQQVMDGLSSLILQNLRGSAHSMYFPTYDPDGDDGRIRDGKARATVLRRLREEFEDLACGVTIPPRLP